MVRDGPAKPLVAMAFNRFLDQTAQTRDFLVRRERLLDSPREVSQLASSRSYYIQIDVEPHAHAERVDQAGRRERSDCSGRSLACCYRLIVAIANEPTIQKAVAFKGLYCGVVIVFPIATYDHASHGQVILIVDHEIPD